ncbi:helix-turn-helix transcriptional regulator [Photobacterium indicum]|uniref:helix-turn-helix transcriptional regulator n=1 Tax=Photobacterium indicum TaxID=81447 RepID=UPI003D0E8F16
MAISDLTDPCQQINTLIPTSLLSTLDSLFLELSSREVECLYWFAFGLSRQAIAEKMQVSKPRIDQYLRSILSKIPSPDYKSLIMIYNCRVFTYQLKMLSEIFNYIKM